uniref:Protein TEX261 n=1 Tax=Syphacia muris TaxID=451379 RepID=A0A0N5ARP9_9BILA
MGLPYVLQWGGILPPYYKYAVMLLCGFELCWSALTLAVGQQYYEYSEILFPIAFDIFDERTTRINFFSVYSLMCFCVIIFFTVALANAAVFLWIYYTAPADNQLFFSKFNKVEIGEEYVTRIEQGLHCNSDEDLENIPLHTTCDFSVKRSVVNRQLLTPLLYVWIYGHAIILLLFGFFNKEFGIDSREDDEDIGKLI